MLQEMVGKEHSRENERQADILGTRVLSKAGYAADGLRNLMVTLNTLSGGKERTTWQSTHPAPAERVQYLESLIQRNNYNRYTYEGVKQHKEIQNLLQGISPTANDTPAVSQPVDKKPARGSQNTQRTKPIRGVVEITGRQTRENVEIRLDGGKVESDRNFSINFIVENRSDRAFGFVPLYAQVVTEGGRRLTTKFSSAEALVPAGGTIKGTVQVLGLEVAHEILILHWSNLRWWLDENRDRLHQQQRLEKKLQEWEHNQKHPDFLLQKTQLTEAETYYYKYQGYLTPQEKEYIRFSQQARLKNRLLLGSVTAISLLFIFSASIIAWQQQKQNQLAQLIRYSSFHVITPDIAKTVVNSLSTLLNNAEINQQSGKVEQALDDYRQILAITTNIQQKIIQEPQNFTEIQQAKLTLAQSSQKAENKLAEIISKSRLPQLEAELKQGNFGELVVTDFAKFENQYTGALKISYAMLMRESGAKADVNNDGYLTEGEENLLPCKTLQEIAELWRKYTENRCDCGNGNGDYLQPDCRELQGQNLTIKLSFPPAAYLLERRLQECKIISVK